MLRRSLCLAALVLAAPAGASAVTVRCTTHSYPKLRTQAGVAEQRADAVFHRALGLRGVKAARTLALFRREEAQAVLAIIRLERCER